MDSDLLLFLSSSDSEEECNLNIIRKQIRDKSNPLTLPPAVYVNMDLWYITKCFSWEYYFRFKQRFRLTKDAFRYVLSELHFSGHMSTAVPPILQLAATLSLLACGSFQHCVGNDFILGLSQSALCKITNRVSREIQKTLCPCNIKFVPEESMLCREEFVSKYNIPGG